MTRKGARCPEYSHSLNLKSATTKTAILVVALFVLSDRLGMVVNISTSSDMSVLLSQFVNEAKHAFRLFVK